MTVRFSVVLAAIFLSLSITTYSAATAAGGPRELEKPVGERARELERKMERNAKIRKELGEQIFRENEVLARGLEKVGTQKLEGSDICKWYEEFCRQASNLLVSRKGSVYFSGRPPYIADCLLTSCDGGIKSSRDEYR